MKLEQSWEAAGQACPAHLERKSGRSTTRSGARRFFSTRNPRFLLQTASQTQPILQPLNLAALPRMPMPSRVFLSLNSKVTPTVVALFVCLLAPSVAGASCGDYVMVAGVREHAGRSVARHEILVSLAHRHHPASPK